MWQREYDADALIRCIYGYVTSVEITNCQWHIERNFRDIFCRFSEVQFFSPWILRTALFTVWLSHSHQDCLISLVWWEMKESNVTWVAMSCQRINKISHGRQGQGVSCVWQKQWNVKGLWWWELVNVIENSWCDIVAKTVPTFYIWG